jgi:hypothetical protein
MVTLVLAEQAKGDQDGVLNTFLAALREVRGDWRQSDPELRRIDSVAFLGADWSGTDAASSTPMKGFVLVGFHGGWVIALTSQDVAAHADESLELARQSFETLRLESR